MAKELAILWLLALPLLALAQTTRPPTSQSASQTVITSTSVSTFVSTGPDNQATSGTRTFVFTTTVALPPPGATGSGNSSTNGTATGNSTSTSTTSTKPLPTAPTGIDGGGGTNGAPVPGATGAGGIYGPDDSYIAGALTLKRNTLLVGLGGLLVGGALLVL